MTPVRLGAALLGCWAALALSCAAAGRTISHDERELARARHFDFARLTHGGLSAIGVTSGAGPQGIRDDVAFVIDQGLTDALPSGVRFVSRSDTMDNARQAGMLPDLQRLVRGYEQQGVFDAGLLRRMAALEGVRYFFVTTIVAYQKVNREVAATPSSPVGVPQVHSLARRPYERIQRVRLRGEIWDSRCGDLVWTGEGATDVLEDPAGDETPLGDVVAMAATNLISVLPKAGDGRRATTEKECG